MNARLLTNPQKVLKMLNMNNYMEYKPNSSNHQMYLPACYPIRQ